MKLIKQIAAALTVGSLIAILTATLLLAVSCKRNTSERADNDSYSSRSSAFWPRGFVSVQNAPVYELSSDDKAMWIGSPDFGEPLELDQDKIGKTIKQGKFVEYKPRQIAIDDNYAYLIPVIWKDFHGWIAAENYAGENSQIGVAVKTFTATNNTFKAGELVVFDDKDKESTIAPYFSNLNTKFIQSAISFNTEDIEAAKLLAKARAERNSERAAALLKEAAEQYPSSVIFPIISELLNPQEEAASRESIAAAFSTASENATVYAAPDFSAKVVKRLEQYTDVRTTERTITPVTSKAESARWYHISEPVEGWVFGLDLEGAD